MAAFAGVLAKRLREDQRRHNLRKECSFEGTKDDEIAYPRMSQHRHVEADDGQPYQMQANSVKGDSSPSKRSGRSFNSSRSGSTVREILGQTYDQSSGGWRRRAWILMEEPTQHPVAERIHYFYSGLIIMSVCTMILQTLEGLSSAAILLLDAFEYCCNIIFTLEVMLRIVCAPQRRALFRSMYTWMDVGAIVPFYTGLILGARLRENAYLELLNLLVPILRLLKITRHSSGWRILIISMHECATPLVVPAFLLVLIAVLFSSVIFWLEKNWSCKGSTCLVTESRAFDSIPHTMWYTICTISSVGYGDVSPNTDEAKLASAALIIAGVCYMAMPLTIVGQTFCKVWTDRDRILMRDKTRSRMSGCGVTTEQLRKLFEAADEDGSGYVDKTEFVELVEAFDLGFSHAQIAKLFRTIDDNGSNSINFAEFVGFLFPEVEDDATENANSVGHEEKASLSSECMPPPAVLQHLEAFDSRLNDVSACIGELRAEQQKQIQDATALFEEALAAVKARAAVRVTAC
mmetsp:Transcript_114949/g.245454  ORF Transcript_114949/g.245454 Transcript_114949/m.245454 type:complete len:519 (+) Transcript_114949:45-1601(+)